MNYLFVARNGDFTEKDVSTRYGKFYIKKVPKVWEVTKTEIFLAYYDMKNNVIDRS